MILGCITTTLSSALFFQNIETLEFWVKKGQMAVWQLNIPRLPEGSLVLYLGEIEQKVIRTKAAKSFSVLDDKTIIFDGEPVIINHAVARVFTRLGLGYVLKLKLKND